MKTVGVLGGVGPQATIDFEDRFHRAAQGIVPQRLNGGYPPLIVFYLRHAPVLMGENGRPREPLEPDPRLFDAARRLGSLVDFLVIPSNTPHLFAGEIERASGRALLSIVALTLNEVEARAWRRVGVVGLGKPTVYTEPLGARGVSCETLDPPLRDELDRCILAFMEGRSDEASTAVARRGVETLRSRGVDGIVLGCTEVPLLLGQQSVSGDIVNPAQLLAEAAVRYAVAN